MISFSYCLDAAGNLVRVQPGLYPEALIPGAVVLATTVTELSHPLPWTTTLAEAVKEVRFVPLPHVQGTPAEQVHKSGVIPQQPFVFVPPNDAAVNDDDVAVLIDLFDQLPPEHEGRVEIVDELKKVGIEQIPFIAQFWPELHSGITVTVVTSYTSPGWISHSKVYRKASIA
ncbi:hypothetical protein [Pseudomonas syringae]|uniref:hypothetical protein n=1 Tax=Pseudomonas syringae TaxID=317 RepID=UPI001F33C115|nr:hypothetical protein [Pseudomonas syringae]MCF5374175.1 hypothetical protein [Pseudomonas syringae]